MKHTEISKFIVSAVLAGFVATQVATANEAAAPKHPKKAEVKKAGHDKHEHDKNKDAKAKEGEEHPAEAHPEGEAKPH